MRSFHCNDSQCGSAVGRGREALWYPKSNSIFNPNEAMRSV